VPLLRRRAERLGEDDERGKLDRNLAALGGEHFAVHTDEIAEIKVFEDVELFVAERLLLRVNLHPTALVLDINEHALAHLAVGGDAAGQGDGASLDVIGAGLGSGLGGGKFVGKRIDAFRPERGQFGFALFDQ